MLWIQKITFGTDQIASYWHFIAKKIIFDSFNHPGLAIESSLPDHQKRIGMKRKGQSKKLTHNTTFPKHYFLTLFIFIFR